MNTYLLTSEIRGLAPDGVPRGQPLGRVSRKRGKSIMLRTYLKIDWRGQMVHAWAMLLKLTDRQWDRIRDHFSKEGIPLNHSDRYPVPEREALNVALWILATGTPATNPHEVKLVQLRLGFYMIDMSSSASC